MASGLYIERARFFDKTVGSGAIKYAKWETNVDGK